MRKYLFLLVCIVFSKLSFSQSKVIFQNTDGTDLPDTVSIFYHHTSDHLTLNCLITNIDTLNGYKVRLKRIVKQSVHDGKDLLCFGLFCSEFSSTQIEGYTAQGDSLYKNSTVSTNVPWELITFTPDSTQGLAIYQYFIQTETEQKDVYIDQDSVIVFYDLTGVNINESQNTKEYIFESYPNPVTNHINIRYHFMDREATVVIKNILGMVVKTISLEDHSNTLNFSVDEWKSGVYFITLHIQGKASVTNKIVKN